MSEIYKENKSQNMDPITGNFNHEDVNPDMLGGGLRGRKPSLSRLEFLKLAALGGALLAGCTPIGREVTRTLKAGSDDLKKDVEPEPTLDPELVAQRVRELKDKSILETPETGFYNPDALARWTELSPQPKIDERIDISIHPSRYVRGEGSLEWHLAVATGLGFQAVAIVASPPEHVNHTGIDTPPGITLDELIKRDYYTAVFNHPEVKRVHLTCDVNGPGTVNGWMIPNSGAFSAESLESTYQEYRRTADYLLQEFGGNGKDIIVGGPNEIDLLAKGGFKRETEDQNWQEAAVHNAILYFDMFHRAIRDANNAHPDRRPLKTGLEILQFRTLWDRDGVVNALSAVVPNLQVPPNEVSLSAWQVAGKGQEGYLLGRAVDLMKTYAPQSAISISEFGVADGDRPELTRDQVADEYGFGISAALANGASRVTVWGLTGFDAEKNFPNNNEIRGLGLIRPDGSLRGEVYKELQSFKANT